MRIKQLAGVLAVLALALTSCGIIAPDASVEIFQDDIRTAQATLSPDATEATLEVVNTGKMRAHFDVKLNGESDWLSFAQSPAKKYLDPDERAEFVLSYKCEPGKIYTGSIAVDYEKQIGQWASFHVPVRLECQLGGEPESPEAGLQFMYGRDSLSGLELDGETSEITIELQNNGLEDLQVNLETSEEWLRIITVQSNPRLVAKGASLEIQLKYTCEEVGISPAYLSASVEGGGYITLPVNIEGCDTPPGNDLTVSINGVEASKIELYAQWEEGGEPVTEVTITIANNSLNPVTFALTLPSGTVIPTGWVIPLDASSGWITLGPGDSLDRRLSYACDPSVSGDYSATYEISFPGGSGGNTIGIPITLVGCP